MSEILVLVIMAVLLIASFLSYFEVGGQTVVRWKKRVHWSPQISIINYVKTPRLALVN